MDHYWEERAKRSVERYEQAVQRAIPEMLKAFEQAKKEIVAEMYAFYGRYAKNNEITLAQAKQLLSRKELAEFKGNLAEYEKLARQSIGTFHLEVENISMKIRLNRLEALLMQVDAALQELYQKQQKVIQETTERVTLEEYYHSQYDLSVSTRRVLKFSKVPESFIEQVLTSPVMGADISTRLWRQDIDSGFKIRQYLNQMFIEGKPPQYFAEELGKAIGAVQVGKDGKVIGSGKKYEAYRLLYNEASYAANQARLKAYREMGAPYYELTATLDIRTTPICQSLDGCIFGIYTGGDVPAEYRKTGSEYRQAAYSADRVVVGVNYPPFHVNCRTVAVPHYPTTDTARMTRAARDAEDNPITVPADMKYEEWYETYIEKLPKNVIMKAAKENKIRGELTLNPSKIDITHYDFDDEHINKERKHNVNKEDAQRFIKQAKVSFTRWKGKYVCYVGSEGSTYVDTQKKKIGTCFKRDEYDENTLNFIKEVEKVEDRLSTDEGKD